MTALRGGAWTATAVSLLGMGVIALEGFCAEGLAQIGWIYRGLAAFVLLVALAIATERPTGRVAAVVVAVSGAVLGAVFGVVAGFAGIYPGAC